MTSQHAEDGVKLQIILAILGSLTWGLCILMDKLHYRLIDLSKVPTAILQGVQKHWGERAVTNGAHNIY